MVAGSGLPREIDLYGRVAGAGRRLPMGQGHVAVAILLAGGHRIGEKRKPATGKAAGSHIWSEVVDRRLASRSSLNRLAFARAFLPPNRVPVLRETGRGLFTAGLGRTAMFQVIAIDFEAHQALPTPGHRWLLTVLSRYSSREGRCWPSMRQLAADARMSLATVCRRLREMARLGCFTRERKGVGRYVYQLAEAYVPRWPGRVSVREHRVPQHETQKSNPNKQDKISHGDRIADPAPWENRLRAWKETRFWLPGWGPKPDEAGCWAPSGIVAG